MKRHLFAVASYLFLFSWLQVPAQDHETQNEFTLSGQLRPRFELCSGNFRPLAKDENPAALITTRFRINLNYDHSDVLSMKFSMQEGVYGDRAPPSRAWLQPVIT